MIWASSGHTGIHLRLKDTVIVFGRKAPPPRRRRGWEAPPSQRMEGEEGSTIILTVFVVFRLIFSLFCHVSLTLLFSFLFSFSFFVDFLFRLYLPLLFFFLVCCQGVKKKKLREHAQRIYSPKSRLRSEWSRNAAKLGRER